MIERRGSVLCVSVNRSPDSAAMHEYLESVAENNDGIDIQFMYTGGDDSKLEETMSSIACEGC